MLVSSRFKDIAASFHRLLCKPYDSGANRTILLSGKGPALCWMPGSEEFRKELLERMSAWAAPSHYGAELRESEEEKAVRIIAQEIQRLKFPKIDLSRLSKGDPCKIQIARRLRQETTMTLQWIAERLQTGNVPYTAKLIKGG